MLAKINLLESNGPLYENTIGYIEHPSPLLLRYSEENDGDEHIYDYVENSSVETRPANIFLSLVDGKGTTISPDPNIYEVPPGAIFNTESRIEELFPLSNISPPNGFEDKLTWERLRLIAEKGDDNDEAIYSLPIKFSLNGSAIVKSKKKKLRPGLEELLKQIKTMKESTTEEDQRDCKGGEQHSALLHELTKDVIFKSETPLSVDAAPDCGAITIDNNEVIVESISLAVPSNLTVLNASTDCLTVAESRLPEPETTEAPASLNPKEFTSVIEISGDGTWNTTKVLASHVDDSKNVETNEQIENTDQDFLSASADARAKHVTLAYSGQYYCPVASIKPMKHDDDTTVDSKKNIGAQIMEKYEEERKKIIEIKNLPDVSLLDVDESLEEIQKERRKIIESQAVRAKRIDSWIKGRPVMLDENGLPVKCEEQDCDEAVSSQDPQNDSLVYVDENGEVVYDSIIQNKSKIKTYWEQLMLAAELANQTAPIKTPPPQAPTSPSTVPTAAPATAPVHHVIAEKVHSPDLSEAEFYDALSHVSAVQTPDPDAAESLKLTETVVERDIRIQQERELALVIERQKALKNVKDKTGRTAMKEKEEELQRQQPDEAYLSIPTTDEGNFSEYGSEDKEDHSPDGSRVMSPVGPAGISSHHRTQSLDSMSSGHSSGSGTASHPDLSLKSERRQTFGPVKPLDEPEDDILAYVKDNSASLLKDHTQSIPTTDVEALCLQPGYEKETPIEREIRLARDREEELRRDKCNSITTLNASPPQNIEPDKKETQKMFPATQRVSSATQRVQQEIELASEREKELKRWSSDDLQKVGSTKLVLKPTARKPQPLLVSNGDAMELQKSPNITKNGASPKIYVQNPQQKGLMKRFLASRGKMGSSPRLNSLSSPSSATLPALKTTSLSPNSLLSEPFFSFTSLVQTKEREEPANLGARPGYKSAEDKIQSELREMKRREEELRQQRRSSLYSARSQPDLLNIDNEPMGEHDPDRDRNLDQDEEPTRLPNTSKLRSALSVQNLLDVDDKPAPRRIPKRRSALIEQWENRIQNKN